MRFASNHLSAAYLSLFLATLQDVKTREVSVSSPTQGLVRCSLLSALLIWMAGWSMVVLVPSAGYCNYYSQTKLTIQTPTGHNLRSWQERPEKALGEPFKHDRT